MFLIGNVSFNTPVLVSRLSVACSHRVHLCMSCLDTLFYGQYNDWFFFYVHVHCISNVVLHVNLQCSCSGVKECTVYCTYPFIFKIYSHKSHVHDMYTCTCTYMYMADFSHIHVHCTYGINLGPNIQWFCANENSVTVMCACTIQVHVVTCTGYVLLGSIYMYSSWTVIVLHVLLCCILHVCLRRCSDNSMIL